MYDDLATVYDRFIDWPARLDREVPALAAWLGNARTVADVACGTGRHTAALAAAGYQVTGFDVSAAALDQAAALHAPGTHWAVAPFGSLSATGEGPFDAAVCLGNSLPHVLTDAELVATVDDLAAILRPGGRLLVQLRNLALARQRDERWLPLRTHVDPDGTEWLFQRLYDFLPERRVGFHFQILSRRPGAAWERRIESTQLRAWSHLELSAVLSQWREVRFAADLAGAPFDPATSPDLVLTATR